MIRCTKPMAAQIAPHADSARLSFSGTFAGLGRYWPFIVLLIGLAAVTACRASDASPVPPTPAAQQVQPVPTPGPLPAPTRWVDLAPIGRSYLPAEATTVLLLGTDRRSDDSGYDNTDMLMLL